LNISWLNTLYYVRYSVQKKLLISLLASVLGAMENTNLLNKSHRRTSATVKTGRSVVPKTDIGLDLSSYFKTWQVSIFSEPQSVVYSSWKSNLCCNQFTSFYSKLIQTNFFVYIRS